MDRDHLELNQDQLELELGRGAPLMSRQPAAADVILLTKKTGLGRERGEMSVDEAPRVLEHRVNVYNSVEITDPRTRGATRGPAPDAAQFESDLWHSMREWRRGGHKGVWMTLDRARADLVPVAVRLGFCFHRAERDVLTLNAWLADELPNKLPPGPTHFIGVAGMVLNAKGEVLAIRERSGPSAKLRDFWKLPGGLADPGEDLRDAAMREVKEETGLDTRFLRVASVQEIHHGEEFGGFARAGTSDLYCICVLEALDEAQELVPQEDEVAACRWMPLEELLDSRYYREEGSVFHKMFRGAAQVAQGTSEGLEAESLSFFGRATQTVYAPGLRRATKL